MKRLYTKKEAIDLIDWRDSVFQDAIDKVAPQWSLVSSLMFPRQNGKSKLVFDKLMDLITETLDETLTPYQQWLFDIACDYELIIWQDEEDEGGFEAMSEAYAAGVPVEDILA